MRRLKKSAPLAGLVVLAVVALAVVGFALFRPTSPAPVSAEVQKYYDENVASAKPTLPATTVAPKVAFLGDSYTFGTGATDIQLRWSAVVARSLGWGEVNVGVGGTGYSNPGTKAGGTTYAERVSKVVAAKPSIVVVSGGRNDVVQRDADVLLNAVNATFNDLRAKLPKVKIIALSPVWDDDAPPAELAAVAEDVRAAVTAVGGTYVDVGQPLADHPDAIIADGVHPNDVGHKLLADATVVALTKAGIKAS